MVFFARSDRQVKRALKKETVRVSEYERVMVYVRFKDQAFFDALGRKKLDCTQGSTDLKLFRNVPKAELEILFPNVQVKMRGIHKVLTGVPASNGGIAVLVTKLLSVIVLVVGMCMFWCGMSAKETVIDGKALIAAGAALRAAGGYVLKQISAFKIVRFAS